MTKLRMTLVLAATAAAWAASVPAAEAQTYPSCAAARAAGAAPLRRGQAGYSTRLDRDGDGVACEPYRGSGGTRGRTRTRRRR